MEDNSIINMNGSSQTQLVEDATTLLTSWLGRLQNLEDRGIREFRAYFMRNKMWIEDIEQLGYYFSSGHESHLYRSFSENALLKIKGTHTLYNSIKENLISSLESAILHNQVFPETFYTLVGFNDYGNSIYPVLKQSLIVGRSCNNDELDERLESLGLKKNLGVFTKDGYVIDGLHKGNIMVGSDEKTYVIDCTIRKYN
jgi:hypothetical protein